MRLTLICTHIRATLRLPASHLMANRISHICYAHVDDGSILKCAIKKCLFTTIFIYTCFVARVSCHAPFFLEVTHIHYVFKAYLCRQRMASSLARRVASTSCINNPKNSFDFIILQVERIWFLSRVEHTHTHGHICTMR